MEFSTDIRSEDLAQKNTERRENEKRAKEILSTDSGLSAMADMASEGGPVGRRVEREIRRYETSGRISGWLSNQALKSEIKREIPTQNTTALGTASSSQLSFQTPKTRAQYGSIKYKPEVAVAGGGGGDCVGLQLVRKTIGGSVQVWVTAGSIAGKLPNLMDPIDGISIAFSGEGIVYGRIEIDEISGEVKEADMITRTSQPEDTGTLFHTAIGSFKYENNEVLIVNYGCGSIDITQCRRWYASEAPFFDIRFFR
jgi:hypothetical protein